MNDFKEYIEFKSANSYAEKDSDFERQETPLIKERSVIINEVQKAY
jgi:hypothetical protein